MELEPEDVLAVSKYDKSVKARSLLLGNARAWDDDKRVGKKDKISSTHSKSSGSRGQKIAEDRRLSLLEQINQ